MVGDMITLADDAREAGLAGMMADLISANLRQRPEKSKDFARLDLLITLEAVDAEVAVTLEFRKGSLIVHGSCHQKPEIRISASSELLLGLAAVKIRLGLPDLFGRDARALRRGLLSGRVKMTGALRRPVQLVRFTRLMSVNG
jgi:hypothetical protein